MLCFLQRLMTESSKAVSADDPVGPVLQNVMNSVCRMMTGGWLWYCDVHETHTPQARG